MGLYDSKEIPVPLIEVAEGKPCPMFPDECQNGEPVEPEVDGDHRYYECEECGFAFGYEKMEEGVRIEGSCAIGVPEDVRRSASAPMERAMADEAARQPVPLGISIGRRPGME